MANTALRIATFVLGCATLGACGTTGPSAPSGPSPLPLVDGCVDLGDQIWGMSWSPGGQYLAVSTWDQVGDPLSWLFSADGRPAGAVLTEPGMNLSAIAVGPDGRRAWLAGNRQTPRNSLIEDGALGRRETPLAGPTEGLGWTVNGYAYIERRPIGDAVLVVDPNHPDQVHELHTGSGVVDAFWISPDGKVMVFTRLASDGGTEFQVIDPNGTHDVEPAGADESGASTFGPHLVYHTSGGDMAAVTLADPTHAVVIGSRRTHAGMISDHGLLAEVGLASPATLCFEDVAAELG